MIPHFDLTWNGRTLKVPAPDGRWRKRLAALLAERYVRSIVEASASLPVEQRTAAAVQAGRDVGRGEAALNGPWAVSLMETIDGSLLNTRALLQGPDPDFSDDDATRIWEDIPDPMRAMMEIFFPKKKDPPPPAGSGPTPPISA